MDAALLRGLLAREKCGYATATAIYQPRFASFGKRSSESTPKTETVVRGAGVP